MLGAVRVACDSFGAVVRQRRDKSHRLADHPRSAATARHPRGGGGGTDPLARTSARAHHVEDWTDLSDGAARRAGELAAAAAHGAVICLDEGDSDLEACLGGELHALMSDTQRVRTADEHEREALSIAMRRAALRYHSRRGRADQLLEAAGVTESLLPTVTVVVATRRPHRFAHLVNVLQTQTYPRLEFVVAMHGDGFDASEAESRLAALHHPSRTVTVPSERTLGDVLNAALSAATGILVAKLDDDDEYGPHHLWDLVLAAEYSGAAVVGKTSEYVYLAGADCTVRRFAGFGERYIDPQRQSITGAASLFRRDAMEQVGGWRSMNEGEDKAIVQDIAAQGATVYRTHGAGFLAMRHGLDHTWEAPDSYFIEQAGETRPGCDRHFAGIC